MEAAYENIEQYVFLITRYTALAIEIIGALVLVFSVGRALFCLCRRDIGVRLKLAQGIALALEFKIGGELLRTVYVRDCARIRSVDQLADTVGLLIQNQIKNI